MKKEQSSNSTPKVKYTLAEKYDKENKEQNKKEVDAYERLKSKESDKLPRPTGCRMLILPFKIAKNLKVELFLVKKLWKTTSWFNMWTCISTRSRLL